MEQEQKAAQKSDRSLKVAQSPDTPAEPTAAKASSTKLSQRQIGKTAEKESEAPKDAPHPEKEHAPGPESPHTAEAEKKEKTKMSLQDEDWEVEPKKENVNLKTSEEPAENLETSQEKASASSPTEKQVEEVQSSKINTRQKSPIKDKLDAANKKGVKEHPIKKAPNPKKEEETKAMKEKQAQEDKKKNLAASQKTKDDAKKAIQEGKKLVTVESCENCVSHDYCTHHNEATYKNYFNKLKEMVEKSDNSIVVLNNYNVQKPLLGAFEVKIGEKLVFSKHATSKWPNVESVTKEIVAHFNDQGEKEAKKETA